LLNLIVIKSI